MLLEGIPVQKNTGSSLFDAVLLPSLLIAQNKRQETYSLPGTLSDPLSIDISPPAIPDLSVPGTRTGAPLEKQEYLTLRNFPPTALVAEQPGQAPWNIWLLPGGQPALFAELLDTGPVTPGKHQPAAVLVHIRRAGKQQTLVVAPGYKEVEVYLLSLDDFVQDLSLAPGISSPPWLFLLIYMDGDGHWLLRMRTSGGFRELRLEEYQWWQGVVFESWVEAHLLGQLPLFTLGVNRPRRTIPYPYGKPSKTTVIARGKACTGNMNEPCESDGNHSDNASDEENDGEGSGESKQKEGAGNTQDQPKASAGEKTGELATGTTSTAGSTALSSQGAPLPPTSMSTSSSSSRLQENWIKLLQAYFKRGLIARMLRPYYFRSISMKVDEIMKGTQAQATFLLPFSPVDLFSSDTGGVGLLFKPNEVIEKMYKEDAYTDYNGDSLNPRYKNHINLHSFLTKLTEQAWLGTEGCLKGLPRIEFPSSGHIAADGLMTAGRVKPKWFYTREFHNEVFVHFSDARNNLLAIVFVNPYTFLDEKLTISLLEIISRMELHGIDLNTLPVVRYQPGLARLTCLGSAQSTQIVCGSPWLLPLQLPEIGHNLFTTLALQIDAFMVGEPHRVMAPNCLQQFRSICPVSSHYELQNIVEPDYFHDNIQKLCDGLSNEAKPNFLITLNAVAQRQLFEFHGISFNDEESLLLAFAAVILYRSQQQPGLIQDFISLMRNQGVSSQLISIFEQAITNNVTAVGDERHRVLLYQSILFSALGVDQAELLSILPANAENLRKEQWQIRDSIFGPGRQLPALVLNRGHGWPALLKDLQNLCKTQVAERLRERSMPLQCWPYAEIAITIPPDLCVLELVSGQRGAVRLCPLIEHYAWSGCPRFLGTITRKQLTQPVLDVIHAEMGKACIPLLPCPIPLRAWEVAPDPLSGLSPLDNLPGCPPPVCSMPPAESMRLMITFNAGGLQILFR